MKYILIEIYQTLIRRLNVFSKNNFHSIKLLKPNDEFAYWKQFWVKSNDNLRASLTNHITNWSGFSC